MGHRVRQGDRRALRHLLERHVERPLGRAEVDRRRSRAAPRRRSTRGTGPAPAKPAGHTSGDQLVGDERLVEHRVLALRRPHAERVPRLDDLDARRASRGTKPWTIFGAAGSEVSMAWNPPQRPHRREAAEDLVPADRPAAVDALGADAVDSSSGMSLPASPWRAQSTSPAAALFEDEPARVVAGPQQVGGDAGPVDVHVDGERGRRGVVAEPAQRAASTRRGGRRRRRTRWGWRRRGSPTPAARRSPRRRSGSRGRRSGLARRSGRACRR